MFCRSSRAEIVIPLVANVSACNQSPSLVWPTIGSRPGATAAGVVMTRSWDDLMEKVAETRRAP